MQSSAQGNDLTKRSEGLRLIVYPDSTGKATIGYGHLLEPGESFPNGITTDEAVSLFLIDKARADGIVNRELAGLQVSQGEFDALSDAVFNMGDFLRGSTLLRLLVAGDIGGAREQLERWDHAGGKELAGLHARRLAEMDLWSKGNGNGTENA